MITTLNRPIRLGARSSMLSRIQVAYIAERLKSVWPSLQTEIVYLTTRGDKDQKTPLPDIGGKGLFTLELEQALRSGEIDLAVHSLKDLPVDNPAGLTLAAITERESPFDVLVCQNPQDTLHTLPMQSVIGTSSIRRIAQILRVRPDIQLSNIRGNLDTRLHKLEDDALGYQAIVMAHAGLIRIGRTDVISQVLTPDIMLPAPAQGALAVQCKEDREELLALCQPLMHLPTWLCTTAERAFLKGLGGGCSLPISAYAVIENHVCTLKGRVTHPSGVEQIDVTSSIDIKPPILANDTPFILGSMLAEEAIQQGAQQLLSTFA